MVGSQLLAIMDGELPGTAADSTAAGSSGGGGLMEGHSWIAESGDDVAETFAVSLPLAAMPAAYAPSSSAEPSAPADGSLLSNQQAYVEDAEMSALSLPAAAVTEPPAVLAPSYLEGRRSAAAPVVTAPVVMSSARGTAVRNTAGATAVSSAPDAGTIAGMAAPVLTSAAATPAATLVATQAGAETQHQQMSAVQVSSMQDVPSGQPAAAAPGAAAEGRPAATTPGLAPTAVRVSHA